MRTYNDLDIITWKDLSMKDIIAWRLWIFVIQKPFPKIPTWAIKRIQETEAINYREESK